jgi:2-polyprenyl-3-methyl-5-hydroxy-6-metoxy-1,4-benzoquinol methylase
MGLRERIAIGGRGVREYRGRQVCADTDLHERIAAVLAARLSPPANLVDVGCGEGALALRLADGGYAVTGLDLAPDSPLPGEPSVAYQRVDLTDPAARDAFASEHEGAFDAVLLIEVIEHVRDPWSAVEMCARLARPGGLIVVSTPNITSYFSRFRFLTGGRFHQFEEADLSYGHINPMHPRKVELVMADSGLELLDTRPGPALPVVAWDPGIRPFSVRLLTAVSWLVAAALTPVMRGGTRDGWSLIFVARKPA